MFTGTALSVRLLVYVGLSLFVINGPYLHMVVCISYAYNLALDSEETTHSHPLSPYLLCVLGRSQNTVPIASTQVAIKGIVQYSTRTLEAQSQSSTVGD